MNVRSRRVRDRSISSMPAIGRPERQLNEVAVPLLYWGLGLWTLCRSAMRLKRVFLGLVFFFCSGGAKKGGWGRPEGEWVDTAEV